MSTSRGPPNPLQISQKSPSQTPSVSGYNATSMQSPRDRAGKVGSERPAGSTSSPGTRDPRRNHKFWNKYSTLPEELNILLYPNWKENKDVTCLKLYSMLFHFGFHGKLRPKSKKDLLVDAFERELRPLILDFCIPETQEEEMDDDDDDFDPLHTTNDMLKAEIKKRVPKFHISPNATRHGLLVLYKSLIDSALVLPKSKDYSKSPRLLNRRNLFKWTVEDLAFAIHCRAPHIFVHHSVMFREDYVALYLFSVLEDEDEGKKVIEGYHYSVVQDLVKVMEQS